MVNPLGIREWCVPQWKHCWLHFYEPEEGGGRRIDIGVWFKWGSAGWLRPSHVFSTRPDPRGKTHGARLTGPDPRGQTHKASENMDCGVDVDEGQGWNDGRVS